MGWENGNNTQYKARRQYTSHGKAGYAHMELYTRFGTVTIRCSRRATPTLIEYRVTTNTHITQWALTMFIKFTRHRPGTQIMVHHHHLAPWGQIPPGGNCIINIRPAIPPTTMGYPEGSGGSVTHQLSQHLTSPLKATSPIPRHQYTTNRQVNSGNINNTWQAPNIKRYRPSHQHHRNNTRPITPGSGFRPG